MATHKALMCRLAPLLCLLTATSAGAALAPECYTGYAYRAGSDELAFTARYRPVGEHKLAQKWQVIYRDPAGAIIGNKEMSLADHRFVPEFTMRFTETGNMEGVRHAANQGWQMMSRDGHQGAMQTKLFEIGPDMAADNGIHPFIKAHFKRLMDHQTVRFKFVLAPRMDVMNMRIKRIADVQLDGRNAVRFRMKLDMLFSGWFSEALIFTYDPASRRLLAFNGISKLESKTGEPYPVDIRYQRDNPPEAAGTFPVCSPG